MTAYRDLEHPHTSIDFGKPDSVLAPTAEMLRADIADGRRWRWNYNGMVRVLPVEVMVNGLREWDAWDGHRHNQPIHIGRLYFHQGEAE